MEIDEIIRRLERIAPYGTHYPGEPLFVLSLDDGVAIKEAIELLKKQKPQEVTGMPEWVVVVTCQGQPFFYPQKNLLCGLVALAWHYLKKRKFGTMNFKLEQRWR